MDVAARQPPARLLPTLLGGLVASAVILIGNTAAQARGWTALDLPFVLGLTFRRPGQPGLAAAGTAGYFLSGGVLVPSLYWLALRGLGRSGPGTGALLGLAHLAAASGLLALSEPRPPRRRGRGRPMGALLRHYGWLERTANVLGHLGYGAVVGMASRGGATGAHGRSGAA
jgi:hypothetical protein